MDSSRPSMDGRQPANAALRGGGLIVLSVMIGVALLAWGFSDEGGLTVDTDPTGTTASANGNDNDNGAGDENGDPDPDPTDDGTTPDEPGNGLPDARAPEETAVYVRNGSGVTGAAGRVRDHLAALNYLLEQPDNTPERVTETRIFYTEGWRAEAILIANELNVADTGVVEQIPTPAPGGTDMGDASILVLLGEDQLIGVAQGNSD